MSFKIPHYTVIDDSFEGLAKTAGVEICLSTGMVSAAMWLSTRPAVP